MKKRQMIGIGIALSLMMLNIGFIIISLPIFLIVAIDYLLTRKKNKEKIIEYEVPIEEETNIDSIRAFAEKAEQEKQKWIEYRRNVDLRQFKGRNDVTRKEVEDYLWYHKVWEGHHEKWIILDEIMKVSNLTEDDCKAILYNHYHRQTRNGEIAQGHWIRNEETKRILDYEKRKVLEKEKEYEDKMNDIEKDLKVMFPQIYELTKRPNKKDDEYNYIFKYEDWLKERGYQ